MVDENAPRNQWRVGRVTDVMPGEDGLVRAAEVCTASTTMKRPVTKLCFLEGR